MITDAELRELFQQKAEEMDIDRGLPEELLKRVRRRQRLIALASTAAVVAVVMGVWMGAGSAPRSEAIPPADNEGVAEEIDIDVRGRTPTVERLDGIWLNDGGPTPGEPTLLLRFEPDGTVAFDNGGYLDSAPAVIATYEVNGDTISFRTEGGEACREGDDWTWRAGVPDEGRLHIVFVEDGTGNCGMGIGTEWTFTRVSPSSPAGEQITAADLLLASSFEHPSGDLRGAPPPGRYSLFGIYLLEGTGRLMKFTAQESYSTDDAGELGVDPQDQGSIENNEKGTLRFVSGADSDRCDQGAVTVWRRAQVKGRVLKTVVARDDCGGRVGDELTWIRLTP
jgi:hypothetical protein